MHLVIFIYELINSILKFKTFDKHILLNIINFNGEFHWNKYNNQLNFSNLFFNNLNIDNGKLNFYNIKGIIKINLSKLSLEKLKYFVDQNSYFLNFIKK